MGDNVNSRIFEGSEAFVSTSYSLYGRHKTTHPFPIACTRLFRSQRKSTLPQLAREHVTHPRARPSRSQHGHRACATFLMHPLEEYPIATRSISATPNCVRLLLLKLVRLPSDKHDSFRYSTHDHLHHTMSVRWPRIVNMADNTSTV